MFCYLTVGRLVVGLREIGPKDDGDLTARVGPNVALDGLKEKDAVLEVEGLVPRVARLVLEVAREQRHIVGTLVGQLALGVLLVLAEAGHLAQLLLLVLLGGRVPLPRVVQQQVAAVVDGDGALVAQRDEGVLDAEGVLVEADVEVLGGAVEADVDRLRRVVADHELATELATLLGLEVHGHLRHKLERGN